MTTTVPNATEAERLAAASAEDTPVSEQLADKAHRKVDQAAAGAAEAEKEIRRAASDAADHFRRSEAELADALDQNIRKVREYIEKNPIQSAGIAFAAGIVLSSLLRR